jgi:hypothetical protein
MFTKLQKMHKIFRNYKNTQEKKGVEISHRQKVLSPIQKTTEIWSH